MGPASRAGPTRESQPSCQKTVERMKRRDRGDAEGRREKARWQNARIVRFNVLYRDLRRGSPERTSENRRTTPLRPSASLRLCVLSPKKESRTRSAHNGAVYSRKAESSRADLEPLRSALEAGDEDPKRHRGGGRSNDRDGLEPFPDS